MKNPARPDKAAMSADAYAGFLKLWLTPANQIPKPSAELDAYLRFANESEPLSETARRAIGQPTEEAA